MKTEQIASLLLGTIGATLVAWRASGVEFACVVDGEAWPFEAGTSRADATARAASLNVELLELADTDQQTKLGEALLASLGRHMESHLAGALASGAPKA